VTGIPTLFMIGADKGGTGKTVVCRALVDYLRVKKVEGLRIFDTQTPAGDLRRFAPDAQVINITRIEDQMRLFDQLDGITIIDIQAGLLSYTLRALDDANLLADVRNGTVNLVLLHVLGPTITSLGEIPTVVGMIGGGVRHLLVKNYISASTEFFEWDRNGPFAEMFKRATSTTITVPHLADRAGELVQNKGVSFDAYASDAQESRVLRGAVRRWLDAVWADFDKVGIGVYALRASPFPGAENV
jgi:hypothetical protein